MLVVHGSDIIRNSPISPGFMSEEGSEHNNKKIRQNREHHARQMSVKLNLLDVFRRSVHSSDPLILQHIEEEVVNKRNSRPIPEEVLELFDFIILDDDSESSGDEQDVDMAEE